MSAICWRCVRIANLCLVPAAFILNLIHPLLHGTPLDAGALDVLIQNLNASLAVGKVHE
jgi:hypothetical protein